MPIRMTRRQSLIAAAAAAGAAWFDVPRLLADSRAQSHRTYGGFPMGIQSYSLRHFDTHDCLHKINELGLHYVEFFRNHYPPTTDTAAIRAMDEMLADHDVTMSCHGVQGFTADHAKNKEFFEFARLARVPIIAADFGPEAHESLTKLVKEYDIRLAAHNHGPGHRWDKITDLEKQIAGLDPRIGVCADLGHFIRSGEDPVKAIHTFRGRLYGIHLKDFKEPKRDAKGCVLGEGLLDVPAVFKALREVKFPADGALSVEYEEKPQDPMEDLRKCLAVASEAARKTL
jgi:inosose dehydratase